MKKSMEREDIIKERDEIIKELTAENESLISTNEGLQSDVDYYIQEIGRLEGCDEEAQRLQQVNKKLEGDREAFVRDHEGRLADAKNVAEEACKEAGNLRKKVDSLGEQVEKDKSEKEGLGKVVQTHLESIARLEEQVEKKKSEKERLANQAKENAKTMAEIQKQAEKGCDKSDQAKLEKEVARQKKAITNLEQTAEKHKSDSQ